MEILKQENGIKIAKLELNVAETGHITNSYIVYDVNTKNGIIIDPGYDGEGILKVIKKIEVNLKAIILTHVHADHIGALEYLYNKYKEENKHIIIYMHKEDIKGLYDDRVCGYEMLKVEVQNIPKDEITGMKEQDIIAIDSLDFEVIHTPGHTAGSIILYEKTTNTIISGDTIFAKTYGRTDLATGSSVDMRNTLDKIFNRFNDVDVYPGHDEVFNLKDAKRRIRLLFAYKG